MDITAMSLVNNMMLMNQSNIHQNKYLLYFLLTNVMEQYITNQPLSCLQMSLNFFFFFFFFYLPTESESSLSISAARLCCN